jgi:hypothetical protein
MKKIRKTHHRGMLLPWVGALLLVLTGTVQAQLATNISIDLRALSLGNAVTADPPSISAVHYNPAGLASWMDVASIISFCPLFSPWSQSFLHLLALAYLVTLTIPSCVEMHHVMAMIVAPTSKKAKAQLKAFHCISHHG